MRCHCVPFSKIENKKFNFFSIINSYAALNRFIRDLEVYCVPCLAQTFSLPCVRMHTQTYSAYPIMTTLLTVLSLVLYIKIKNKCGINF